MARKQLSSRQLKFENSGDTFVGELRGEDTVQIRNQPVAQYTFVDSEGKIATCLGSAGLNPILSSLDVGTIVEIVYASDTKTSNGFMKDFEVYQLDSFDDAESDEII